MPWHTSECLYCGRPGGSYETAEAEHIFRVCYD